MKKLPISAMIVGYNEAKFLSSCLESISFCDEIIYTDLGSNDTSVDIAKKYTDKIFFRDRRLVPSCEMVQAEMVTKLKHDWVIFIDPDERADPDLVSEIFKLFKLLSTDHRTGAIIVPWHFYFKNKRLKGTVWGGGNKKYFLVNRNRFDFLPVIHYGRILKPEFESLEVKENLLGTNILHHYWMNSYPVFFKKHRRYLKNEGRDNYNAGVRVGIKSIIKTPFKEFYLSYILRKGYKDLFTGFWLSAFWAYYKTHIAMSIYRLQRNS